MENEMGLLEQQSKDLKNFLHKSNENIRGGGKKTCQNELFQNSENQLKLVTIQGEKQLSFLSF